MGIEITHEDFLNLFELDATDYYDPIILNDTECGFSVKRKYPDNIAYKPSIRKDGKPNDIAVIWVVLRSKTNKDNINRKLVTTRISTYDIWHSKHLFDEYDENNPESPTKESLEKRKSSPQPESLQNIKGFSMIRSCRNFLINQVKG